MLFSVKVDDNVICIHSFHCLLFSLSSSNPSEMKKESSTLNIAKLQGKHGSTLSPQPKFLTQHPLQKQGNTEQTQDVQNRTVNGLVAQNRLDCRDGTLVVNNAKTAIHNEEASFDSGLVNGERECTRTDSMQTTTSCKGQTINSCCLTPSVNMLFPSGKETVKMMTDTEEKQAEAHSKQEQHVETKVWQCNFLH